MRSVKSVCPSVCVCVCQSRETRVCCDTVQDLAHVHEILKNIFLLFPNYCLGRGLMDVAFNEYYNQFCFKMGTRHYDYYSCIWLLGSRHSLHLLNSCSVWCSWPVYTSYDKQHAVKPFPRNLKPCVMVSTLLAYLSFCSSSYSHLDNPSPSYWDHTH